MDEIFDRITDIKIKRKDLFLPLVLTEVLGILVLIWFLRIPLTQKYLISTPQSYSVDTMDTGKQYLIRQGDFITGKTLPNSTLQILLYPYGSKHALLADSGGNFKFQIPEKTGLSEYRLIIVNDNIDESTYDLTVGVSSLDRTSESGKPTAIKDLRIRVTSNNKLDQLLRY